jgi:transposase-like protein
MKTITEYSSIMEVVETFHDETENHVYLQQARWGEQITCPHCSSEHVYKFRDRKRFKCKACLAHFNVKTGTFYEGTKLSLKKWFIAMYLDMVGCKGISSYELAKQIKVTQPTAWFMLTRLRAGMVNSNEKEDTQMEGIVEVDETWIGGKMKNVHKKRKRKHKDWKYNKTIVVGMLNRGGKVKCMVVPDRTYEIIKPILFSSVKKGSRLITDEHSGYNGMEYHFTHNKVNHTGRVYSEGDTSTNGVENFWSILKRGIKGVHHHVSKKHVDKYVQEFVFRHNVRNSSMIAKMELLIKNSDVRLKLKDLKKAA